MVNFRIQKNSMAPIKENECRSWKLKSDVISDLNIKKLFENVLRNIERNYKQNKGLQTILLFSFSGLYQ